MKRLFIYIFLAALGVANVHAQPSAQLNSILNSRDRATSKSGELIQKYERLIRNLELSNRTIQSDASKIKQQPQVRKTPLFNGESQGLSKIRGRNNGITFTAPQVPKKKSAHIAKSTDEELDKLVEENYDRYKSSVAKGEYDVWPIFLLQFADYAKRHNDDAFAIECIARIKSAQMLPQQLESIPRIFPALAEFMPEMSRSVTINAYTQMLNAKYNNTDCDSARMQAGDTLLIVTDQYNPSLNPLVILSCFYYPSAEVRRYKEAADSVIATYSQWSDEFKDVFARDFFITLVNNENYATALDYFGREPLRQFPDSHSELALDLATCALHSQNDTLFNSYLQKAFDLDSVAANNYWAEIYFDNWEHFIATPSQTDLADWLLEMSPMPANNAVVMAVDLMERYWPDADSAWDWCDLSDLSPAQIDARLAILHILNKGESIDNGLSAPDILTYCAYLKAQLMIYDPDMLDAAKELFDSMAADDVADLRVPVTLLQAYIAAHGLDKPKAAMKILKKNIKILDSPDVTNKLRQSWYDYMATLATRMGKTKDAENYNKLKAQFQSEDI